MNSKTTIIRNASQLAGAAETRLACDGCRYTRMEFIEWYGDTGEQKWSDTAPDCVSNSDASQLAAGRTDAVAELENTVVSQPAQTPDATSSSPWLTASWTKLHFLKLSSTNRDASASDTAPDCVSNTDASQLAAGRTDAVAEPENTVVSQLTLGTTNRDAPQLLAGSADAPAVSACLMPEHVIAIQQQEAARGPPRSLHRLARAALKAINNMPNRAPVDLDPCFPWKQYVAAHRQSDAIIGPGITHALAVFFTGTNDSNRGGAPRLDFCFYRTDGTFCRVHPGTRPKEDANLIFENYQ
jgi:hypothetical protein